jgi:uncharacterized membrane protein
MTSKYSSLLQCGFQPRALLLLWSAALLTAIVAAPLAVSAARPEGWFLYQAFAPFCHQQPQRSWHLQGYPLAVCARCVGVYSGLLLAALLGVRLPARTIAIALVLLGAAWAAEFTGLAAASDRIRFVTGLALGCSAGAVVLAGSLRRPARTENVSLNPAE